jgi:glycosyltransferase involved in cell wall biosynthesis
VTSHRVDASLGGVERFVVSFSSWCSRQGIPVKVLSRSLSISSVKISQGEVKGAVNTSSQPLIVKKVRLPYVLYCFGMTIFSFLAFVSLLRIVKSSRIKGNNIILHSQDMNFAAIATNFVGKALSVPTVLHAHGPYVDMLKGNSQRMEKMFNMFNSRLCTRMIVTDGNTANYVSRISGRGDKISVIPAAVDISVFKTAVKSYSNSFTVGYVGRLSPEKSIETLLVAFRDFKSKTNNQSRLVLVGDGESRQSLKQLAINLGISENVTFAGFQLNVAQFLHGFDVYVLPSRIEGTPISLMEAMATGKAIVCSDIPSLREIVIDGVDGLWFKMGNARELSKLLVRLHNEPDLLQRLGLNALESSKRFDVDVVYDQILSSYS